jgi:hypothetical protein
MNEIREWSMDGMIPTGENQNTQKKYLSQNPGFCGEWMATNCLNHSRTYEKDINCAYTSKKTVCNPH